MSREFPLDEFHCIMPIANIASVMQRGILSHDEAAKLALAHESIANEEVQQRRAHVHHYANLYFHARNPMMYRLKFLEKRICVLAVSVRVMWRNDVRLTDMNAAKSIAKQYPAWQWPLLDFDSILARSWHDDDETKKRDKKARRCAEILVPFSIPYSYITHAYVKNDADCTLLQACDFDKPIRITPDLFFV